MYAQLRIYLALGLILMLGLAVAPALAAKGGNGGGNGGANGGGNAGGNGGGNGGSSDTSGSSSIDLVGTAALGSSVTFAVTYPSSTKNPRIDVTCSQNGSVVYAEAGDTQHVFVLGGYASDWKTLGGPASCTARLFDLIWNGNNPQEVVWLASKDFDAAG